MAMPGSALHESPPGTQLTTSARARIWSASEGEPKLRDSPMNSAAQLVSYSLPSILSRGRPVPAGYSRHVVGAGGNRTENWRRATRRKIIPAPDSNEGTALLPRAARAGGNLATWWEPHTQALTAGSGTLAHGVVDPWPLHFTKSDHYVTALLTQMRPRSAPCSSCRTGAGICTVLALGLITRARAEQLTRQSLRPRRRLQINYLPCCRLSVSNVR